MHQRSRSPKGRDETIEFSVEAEEDLVLGGTARSIKRVRKGEKYPCLMHKSQKFSSLFRHYAKHHGLPCEALEYFFTARVACEDTPESVFLQRNDCIRVRAVRKTPPEESSLLAGAHGPCARTFSADMLALLRGEGSGGDHYDVTFLVQQLDPGAGA